MYLQRDYEYLGSELANLLLDGSSITTLFL
jgi:hypothetical protein